MSERGVPWWRRRWASVGELVGVAALIIAALGYWDAHRERHAAGVEKAAAATRERRRESLVLTAAVRDDGARLTLTPLQPGQAVQSQRYVFPTAVLDHPMEVVAAQPQIDRDWIAAGLAHALQVAAEARGAKLEGGEGAVPVAILSSYIEDGESHNDVSLYRVGFRFTPGGLFGGRRLVLQGVSLVRHGVAADPRAAVDASWRASASRPLATAVE